MKLFVKENSEAKEQPVIIISAELERYPNHEKEFKTMQLEAYLNDFRIEYKQARGSYKNVEENCFVTFPKDDSQKLQLCKFGRWYGQESILERNEQGVYLVFVGYADYDAVDFNHERIGSKLVAVPKVEAMAEDAWTFCDGRYYIVK